MVPRGATSGPETGVARPCGPGAGGAPCRRPRAPNGETGHAAPRVHDEALVRADLRRVRSAARAGRRRARGDPEARRVRQRGSQAARPRRPGGVPNLRLELQDVLASGHTVVARVCGTERLRGGLMGLPATGRSIDVRPIDLIWFGRMGSPASTGASSTRRQRRSGSTRSRRPGRSYLVRAPAGPIRAREDARRARDPPATRRAAARRRPPYAGGAAAATGCAVRSPGTPRRWTRWGARAQ